MVYIHVKKIGDKRYYTLRISLREGNKVITKDIINLGDDVSKINIDDLDKKYHKEIRKSYHTIKKFLESNYYVEKARKLKSKKDPFYSKNQAIDIEAVKIHYKNKFLKENELTQEEIYENFLINFAVNSTAIEGNTITLKEAYDLFREDIMPKNRKLREVHDLTNTKKVFYYLIKEKPKINLDLIEKIHDMLLENIDKRKGYRNHDIRILGQPFKPSPARYVKADMNMLLKWYNGNKDKISPLALVTFLHHKFEKIHPFSDGNGRTGRMLINYILMNLGYPPFLISRRFREEYLRAMSEADGCMQKGLLNIEIIYYSDLLEFIHSQFIFTYWDLFLI